MRALGNDELGIGIACGSGSRAQALAAGYDFVEGPPQARVTGRASATVPARAILNGSWLPLGGSCDHEPALLALMREDVERRRPAYVVEGLGFNRFATGRKTRETGLLLPSAHTLDGVAVAVRRIADLRERVGVPVAFEIGANVLPKAPHELSDAEFFATIALHADCGIVVDLASVWANEANGRESASPLFDGLPLERVWEVQVSGTTRRDGYVLDTHDDLADAPVRRLAERLVPRLPALRALVYEVRPASLVRVAGRALAEQREWLTALWETRGSVATDACVRRVPDLPCYDEARTRVRAWERGIVSGVTGNAAASEHDARAFAFLGRSIATAREAAIAEGAELSLRLLAATLGRQALAECMERYCAQTSAHVFPEAEALAFLQFVERERTEIPFLREVVALERAAARAPYATSETAVYFPCEPSEIFRALLRHDRPYVSDRRPHVVHVGPRGLRIEGAYLQAG